MIPQRNLSLLANRLHREHEGRRIPESVLERDYCLAWFLVGLSQSRLSQLLIFKGGTALKQRPVLRAYPEFEDLPEDCPVAVYSLNEIATEKVVALSDTARNEPRDLYDLWFLTVEAGVDLSQLAEAITEKLRFRQKNIAGLEDRILKKEQRLKALWTRLGHQIEALPEFDAVFRAVRRELRQAGFAG